MGRVILLALWAVVSRLLGLVRDLSMAWLVGSGWLADALVAATVIPHALRKLLADGVLSMPFTAAAARGGTRPADRDLFPLLQRILALSGALLLVLFACAPVVVKCLAPGGQDPVWIGKAASLLRLAGTVRVLRVFFRACHGTSACPRCLCERLIRAGVLQLRNPVFYLCGLGRGRPGRCDDSRRLCRRPVLFRPLFCGFSCFAAGAWPEQRERGNTLFSAKERSMPPLSVQR